MTARPRLMTIGLLATCCVLLAGPALVSFSTTSPCDQIRNWAESYRGSSPTLEELARHDHAHRLAIFGVLTPADRSGLWREQLRRFGARPELTTQQRDLVNEASGLATATLYSGDPDARAAYQAFWNRAAPAFLSSEHKRLWFDLGAIVPGASSAVSEVPFCDCDVNQPWYGCLNFCWGSPCVSWGPGCGSIGQSSCTGMCR